MLFVRGKLVAQLEGGEPFSMDRNLFLFGKVPDFACNENSIQGQVHRVSIISIEETNSMLQIAAIYLTKSAC